MCRNSCKQEIMQQSTFAECTFTFPSVAGVLAEHAMNTSHDGPIAEKPKRCVVKAETSE